MKRVFGGFGFFLFFFLILLEFVMILRFGIRFGRVACRIVEFVFRRIWRWIQFSLDLGEWFFQQWRWILLFGVCVSGLKGLMKLLIEL